MSLRIAVTVSLVVLFSILTPAWALSTATPEQILCSSSHILAADVLDESAVDCLDYQGRECPTSSVKLTLKIKKLLAIPTSDSQSSLAVGDILTVETSIDNIARPFFTKTGLWRTEAFIIFHVIPPTNTRLSKEELDVLFKDKPFIFSFYLNPQQRNVPRANIWSASLENWIKYKIFNYKDSSCPKLAPDIPLHTGDIDILTFDPRSANLSNEDKDLLDYIADWIKTYSMKIGVKGFADDEETEVENLNLAELRASTVKAFLISKGINPDRIRTAACIHPQKEKGPCYATKEVPSRAAYLITDEQENLAQ
jgi:hypothetical protein